LKIASQVVTFATPFGLGPTMMALAEDHKPAVTLRLSQVEVVQAQLTSVMTCYSTGHLGPLNVTKRERSTASRSRVCPIFNLTKPSPLLHNLAIFCSRGSFYEAKKYQRSLNFLELLNKKSFFLFGPRATGKSTLIKTQLSSAVVFDLLERDTYRGLLKDPGLLSNFDQSKVIVIDEVQKLPFLLDEVHRLIELNGTRFLLSGSSSRKLKASGVNLLAGRAWQSQLFPLCSQEIEDFDLLNYLTRGGLPGIYPSVNWKKRAS